MARITAKEQAITPIYFQTRRETKWSIPPVALPEYCIKCSRELGCNAECEDMNCEHCYCHMDGRDG